MCYTKEISRDSFIINIITCYILFNHSNKKSYKILALFFVFVGLMQLFDWIFWEHQDMSNKNDRIINYIFTKIAMFANHLQPLVLAYIIYVFNGKLEKFSQIVVLLYLINIIFYTLNTYKQIDYTLSKKIEVRDQKEKKSSLFWQWNSKYNNVFTYLLFLLTLSVISYENFSSPLNFILIFINIFTFLLSGYYYKNNSIGRFWCKLASLLPLMFIFMSKLE